WGLRSAGLSARTKSITSCRRRRAADSDRSWSSRSPRCSGSRSSWPPTRLLSAGPPQRLSGSAGALRALLVAPARQVELPVQGVEDAAGDDVAAGGLEMHPVRSPHEDPLPRRVGEVLREAARVAGERR